MRNTLHRITRNNPSRYAAAAACVAGATLVAAPAWATVPPPSIPEPTGLALFAAGAAVVAIAWRLRSRD
jgi:hypothetical protein